MRALLVEDHEEIWAFLSRRLKRRGFDVTVATDGQAGVEQARTRKPDVMLLDMNLPVLDGWSATRELKGRSRDVVDPDHRTDCACHVGRQGTRPGGRLRLPSKPVDFSQLVGQIGTLGPRSSPEPG